MKGRLVTKLIEPDDFSLLS